MSRSDLKALVSLPRIVCAGLALGLCLAAAPALAQEASRSPAADGLDGTIGGQRGGFDGQAPDGKAGSLAMPLGDGFGLELGGLLDGRGGASRGDGAFYGTAGHLFWRDPAEGLIGLYGHYAYADAFRGVELYAGGAEAAGYWDRFTVEGMAGIQRGQALGNAPLGRLNLEVDAAFFSALTGSYYPEDDLRLSIGHQLSGGQHAGQIEAEWGLDAAGAGPLSLFASGLVTEERDAGVLAGLRVYFGESEKPLIQRDREDDSSIVGNLGSIGTMLKFNERK